MKRSIVIVSILGGLWFTSCSEEIIAPEGNIPTLNTEGDPPPPPPPIGND